MSKQQKNARNSVQVISVVNNKGGVGKTTTVINLSKALSLKGNKVLMIDMDSQGNLSQCFNYHQPEHQIIDSLLSDLDIPVIEIADNLFLTPADIRMAYKEKDLANLNNSESKLAQKLDKIKANFDYIIIDCPPSVGIFTTCSLVASNSCLVPVQAEASAFHGVNNLLDLISQMRTFYNVDLTIKGFLFTMIDKRYKIHSGMMELIKEEYKGIHFFNSFITTAVVIKESQVAKMDLYTAYPNSISWQQYDLLANELNQLSK